MGNPAEETFCHPDAQFNANRSATVKLAVVNLPSGFGVVLSLNQRVFNFDTPHSAPFATAPFGSPIRALDLHSKSIHTPTTMINITPQQLRKAANIQEKIQSLQKELGQLLGGFGETAAIEAPKRRKISAAGIARMRSAAKARWAKIKAAKAGKAAQKPKRKMSAQGLANIRAGVRKRMMAQAKGKAVQKPKRKMSAAAKARLSALAKARWAKAKTAGKSRL